MKTTAYRCHVLRKLDMTVYGGSPATVETQHGDVTVRKALTPGYVAELGRIDDDVFAEAAAYGPTPAMALINLGEALTREADEVSRGLVIPFPALERAA